MPKFEQFDPKVEKKEQIEADSTFYPLVNEQLQHRYDRIATKWGGEEYNNTRRDDLIPTLIEAAQIENGHTVLEAMCGPAIVAQLIKEKNPTAKVCGLDFSIGMLNQIPQEGGVMRVQASVLGMPFEDELFDRILLRTAIYDLPRRMQRNALQEITRLMKNDSIFVLQTYITEANTNQILNAIPNMRDRLAGQYQDMGNEPPRYFATKEEFEEWFEKVGLKYEIVHNFVSNIEISKIIESSESNKKQLLDFIASFSKENQKAINFKVDEEGNYTYALPGIIYQITK